MDRKELEDGMHAIGQLYAFYGKEFDDINRAFWSQFVRKQDYHRLMTALRDYPEHGRYAPKPKDIAELIDREKPARGVIDSPANDVPETNCPKEISDAWLYWLPHFHGAAIGGMMGQVSGVSAELAEEMLYMVNREARRTKSPDAIPDQFKIAEIWA